jgi:TrmH family RNA methyltransferase
VIELAASNAQITRLRRLQRRRDARVAEGCIVVEGVQAVRDAIAAGRARSVYLREGEHEAVAALLAPLDDRVPSELADRVPSELADRVPRYVLDAKTFDGIASTVTPQPALAITEWRPATIDQVDFERGAAIVLDAVGDPGNVGTIVRVADAAGACAVFAGPGTADVTSSKVVRAAAGSLLRVPIVTALATDVAVGELQARSVRCVGASARAAHSYDDYDWRGPVALILGSEAHGIDASVRVRLDDEVRIDMAPGAESLNVAIAAAVLAFEIRRRRPRDSKPIEERQP